LMKSAIEIANFAELLPITEVAAGAGILPDELVPFGRDRGKVKLTILDRLASQPDGKLVIVTAITPTKAGEGKTTTSIALTQGLGKRGAKVMLCLREPSMGPVFGVKGGGTGGGYSQVMPMEDINLHFNGDSHAVTAAHSLLAAALDASIYNGNPLRIDPVSVTWPRTVDMNDRELRYSVIGLGGKAHGIPRQNEFVITAASEVMAVFALASDLADLRQRLGRIVVASTYDGQPVTAEQLKVAGAMTVIMKEAIKPNLVQTLEGQPVLVHAGPFGNIAHANNSILADRMALKLADYIVTEAGFASDLGFQKFCDIVCRTGGFAPSAAVLVTTVRATKSHGGTVFNELGKEDLAALRRGMDNLGAHIQIVRQYGLPCVVAVNSFPTDTPAEIALLQELALASGAETVVVHDGFARGGAGATALADAVVTACGKPNTFSFLTPADTPIVAQIEAIATKLYGADGIDMQMQAKKDLERIEKLGMGRALVCMAKTHLSLSHEPSLRNRPTGFTLPVRGLVPSAGAGFVVALCGDMQRMPGLGKTPAFMNIDIDDDGRTVGLF
jgi:formate--tetrahydrofolate ligase